MPPSVIPRRRLPLRGHVAAAMLLAATAVGCSPPSRIRDDDIRTYSVARDAEPATLARNGDSTASAEAGGPTRRVRYEVPAGWADGQAGGMRLATLYIGDPADKREVTIIPASGTLESNVERWQGQLDPEAAPETVGEKAAAAIAAAESLDVAGVAATIVSLRDEASRDAPDGGQSILAAVIPVDDKASLFVKFKGDTAVAARELGRFKEFVASIRWKE